MRTRISKKAVEKSELMLSRGKWCFARVRCAIRQIALGGLAQISEEVHEHVEPRTQEGCDRARQYHDNKGPIEHDTPRYRLTLPGSALPTMSGTLVRTSLYASQLLILAVIRPQCI